MRPSTIVVLLFAAAVSLSCTRDMVAPGLHEAALVADLVPLAGCPAAGDFTLATGYVPQGTPPDRNGDGFVCVKTVPAPGLCGKIGCSALVIVDNNVPLAGNGCPSRLHADNRDRSARR